jgi:predicted RNase H-like HicB family nuclease
MTHRLKKAILTPVVGCEAHIKIYAQPIPGRFHMTDVSFRVAVLFLRSVMKKNLEYYLNLSYSTIIIPDPYGGFVARIVELRGCCTQGETEEEVLKNIKDAKKLWLEVSIERGLEIPEPEKI